MANFAENSGEVAILLEGAEDSGNVFWEFVEAKTSAIKAVSSGGDNAAAGSADCDINVGIMEAHTFGSELAEIGSDVFGRAAEERHDLVAKIVSGDEKDVGGCVLCSELSEEEGQQDDGGFHEWKRVLMCVYSGLGLF